MGTQPGACSRPLLLVLLLVQDLRGEPRPARVYTAPQPDYQEKYFQQVLDHFNFDSYGNQTFPQRYLTTVMRCSELNAES